MERKELDDLLEKNFLNVNSWLNFAEAKNAANIAFVVACIAAIFSIQNMNFLLYIVCNILILSGLISMMSFFPRLGNVVDGFSDGFLKKRKKKENRENLFFFENIKKYAGDRYIKQVSKMYFDENDYIPTKYQIDLSDELVFNSNVASRKYRLFKITVCLDIIAFLLLAIFMILA